MGIPAHLKLIASRIALQAVLREVYVLGDQGERTKPKQPADNKKGRAEPCDHTNWDTEGIEFVPQAASLSG